MLFSLISELDLNQSIPPKEKDTVPEASLQPVSEGHPMSADLSPAQHASHRIPVLYTETAMNLQSAPGSMEHALQLRETCEEQSPSEALLFPATDIKRRISFHSIAGLELALVFLL